MNDRLKRSLLVGEIILCLLPFFCYAMIYRYLPPEIPIHYNFAGTADRFAAKTSAEIIALCGIGFMGLLLGIALRKFIAALAKTQEPDNTITTEKIMIYTQAFLTLFFVVLSMYLVLGIYKGTGPDSFGIYRMAYLTFSVLLVIIGNLLPKLKRNAISGIKTRYSQSGGDQWMRTQRFGGRLFVVGGIAVLIVSLLPLFSNGAAVALSTGILIALTLAGVIFSARGKA